MLAPAQTGPQAAPRKGIILAGGTGSRLHPLTSAVSKQLLPIYDKPLIYYPLSTLMLAGVREVLIITRPEDKPLFMRQLGDGSQWGLSFSYAEQAEPRGLADAYRIGRAFIDGQPSIMMLGDNIIFGHGLVEQLNIAAARTGATLFASHVKDPRQFGVVELDAANQVISVEEKPQDPKSNWAITGLYFFDGKACDFAEAVTASPRGEIEITSVLDMYRKTGDLVAQTLYRGYAWLDAGTHESLLQAGDLVRTLQDRQGLLICSPEEIAYRRGYISLGSLEARALQFKNGSYGRALLDIVHEERTRYGR